jgi:hypothetical protein
VSAPGGPADTTEIPLRESRRTDAGLRCAELPGPH